MKQVHCTNAGSIMVIILITTTLCMATVGVLLRSTVFFNDIAVKHQWSVQQIALAEGLLNYGIAYVLTHYEQLEKNMLEKNMNEITIPFNTLPFFSDTTIDSDTMGVLDDDMRYISGAYTGEVFIKKHNNLLYVCATLMQKNQRVCVIDCTVDKQHNNYNNIDNNGIVVAGNVESDTVTINNWCIQTDTI